MALDPARPAPSGRGRLVLAAVFLTLTIFYGVWYAYSVLLVALLREFPWSRSVVAGAFSTFVLVHGLLGPVIGWLLQRFGPRRLILLGGLVTSLGLALLAETTHWWQLYLSFGLITSVGVSMGAWLPSVALARGWFPDRVGTAIGVASTGIGVGICVLVPCAQLLIDQVGWRWAYRALAALLLLCVVAALALIQDPPVVAEAGPGGARGERAPAWTPRAALRSPRLWLLGWMFFSGNFVTQMLLIHQVAYLVDHGVPAMTAASLGGAVGLISIPGKLGWGLLSDRAGRELAYGLAFACVAASVGALVLAGGSRTAAALVLYAVLIGLGYGVMAPVPPAAVSDLFGGPGFPTIYGLVYTLGGLGLASGTWGAGWLFDRTGSYAIALWLALGMALLSPALLWLAAPRRANPPPESGPGGAARETPLARNPWSGV